MRVDCGQPLDEEVVGGVDEDVGDGQEGDGEV